MRPRKRSISLVLLILGALSTGILVLGFKFAGTVYDYTDTVDGVRLPEVDAIVVLAGGRGRIAVAGDLWNRYREGRGGSASVPFLYFSGVGSQTTFKQIQAQLRPGVTRELKPEQVVIENESSNTEQNALWLVRYARERGWSRVLLVTSRYHMKRAQLIFKKVLDQDALTRNLVRAPGSAEIAPIVLETLSVYQEPYEPGEWIWSVHGTRVTVGEYFKWLYYSRFWSRFWKP